MVLHAPFLFPAEKKQNIVFEMLVFRYLVVFLYVAFWFEEEEEYRIYREKWRNTFFM